MKRIAILLCVLLLLLAACSAPQRASEGDSGTLPTLSDGTPVTPDDPEYSSNNPNRPTFHRSDETQTEPTDVEDAIVVISEYSQRSRRRQGADNSWSFQLPAGGSFTFGEKVPLTLSANAESDGTVTVTFPEGNCYVQNGKLEKQADSVSVSFGDTVSVTVKDGNKEAYYSIQLHHD